MPEYIQQVDLQILSWMRSHTAPALAMLASVVSTIAWKGWLWWLIIGAAWLRKQHYFAAQLGIAMLLAVIAGLPLKSVISRARPDLYASQQLNIPMPELLLTAHSFPSGHTLLAATLAFVVLRFYPGAWAWLAFGFVALVGAARVYLGVHWPTDIIGSIFLGWITAVAAEYICRIPAVAKFLESRAGGKVPGGRKKFLVPHTDLPVEKRDTAGVR